MITQEYLKSILHYSPETGVFTWIHKNVNQIKAGDIAGCPMKKGHMRIEINRRKYLSHRLAFLYMTGNFPEEVDHINRIRGDNRWANLRSCTRSQNNSNKTKQKNNTSSYKGVYWYEDRKKWSALIIHDRVRYHLGFFEDKKEAARVYNLKATELHGDFSYLNEV